MSDEAFYQQLDDETYASTEHTNGPWGPGMQHLGPPSALLTRALEGVPGGDDRSIARVTVEILGPVPVAELHVTARLVRPGRSVEMLEADMTAAGRTVAQARAWRIIHSDTTSVLSTHADRLPGPENAHEFGRPEGWHPGYIDAMEWHSIKGGLGEPGPATVWVRQRIPLVRGEEPTPLQRLMTVADSGNGVSGRLDPNRWWFINTELTVHVVRPPQGEWIGLDAATTIGPHGVGCANSVLHDLEGPVGTGAQALMVRERS
ncbi:thioesterase family protein [Thermocrispum sp.]|uniref:Thioesterase family protein n=2 Tax=Thermocrispum agreste TaxID=37925 RepID=A0ABD6FEK4_9PSEU|nr:thioesterase family protein [Thermocrispum sp.]